MIINNTRLGVLGHFGSKNKKRKIVTIHKNFEL